MWYLNKNSHTDQCNRIDSPEQTSHTNGQLSINTRDENTHWERVYSVHGAGKVGQLHVNLGIFMSIFIVDIDL